MIVFHLRLSDDIFFPTLPVVFLIFFVFRSPLLSLFTRNDIGLYSLYNINIFSSSPFFESICFIECFVSIPDYSLFSTEKKESPILLHRKFSSCFSLFNFELFLLLYLFILNQRSNPVHTILHVHFFFFSSLYFLVNFLR